MLSGKENQPNLAVEMAATEWQSTNTLTNNGIKNYKSSKRVNYNAGISAKLYIHSY